MNCRELENYIDDLLDQNLPESLREVVEDHLAVCLTCNRDLNARRRLQQMTAALPREIQPERDLWPAILDEMVAGGSPASAPGRGHGREGKERKGAVEKGSPLTWVLAAGLTGILLISVWALWRPEMAESTWEVVRLTGNPVIGDNPVVETGRLSVGEWVRTDAGSRAEIFVDTIGKVQVEPNSRVRLLNTKQTEHRLELNEGAIEARIWAPPRLFFVETPSATAVDLGCVYRLEVDESGAGLLQVSAGWVALQRGSRESFVPSDAACRIRPETGPETPYFEDASPAFRQALTRLDSGEISNETLETLFREARARDTLTLWHLISRLEMSDRRHLMQWMESLAPLPAGIKREALLTLEPDALDSYRMELEALWYSW